MNDRSLPWGPPTLLPALVASQEQGPPRGRGYLYQYNVCTLGAGGLKYNQLAPSCPFLIAAAWSLRYLAQMF